MALKNTLIPTEKFDAKQKAGAGLLDATCVPREYRRTSQWFPPPCWRPRGRQASMFFSTACGEVKSITASTPASAARVSACPSGFSSILTIFIRWPRSSATPATTDPVLPAPRSTKVHAALPKSGVPSPAQAQAAGCRPRPLSRIPPDRAPRKSACADAGSPPAQRPRQSRT